MANKMLLHSQLLVLEQLHHQEQQQVWPLLSQPLTGYDANTSVGKT